MYPYFSSIIYFMQEKERLPVSPHFQQVVFSASHNDQHLPVINIQTVEDRDEGLTIEHDVETSPPV